MDNLFALRPGEAGRITCLKAKGAIRRRLMDLGFTAGTGVECVLAAYGHGMRAYRLRQTVIALREKDARQVMIEEARHE